jgi:hypothetical protein
MLTAGKFSMLMAGQQKFHPEFETRSQWLFSSPHIVTNKSHSQDDGKETGWRPRW